MFKRHNRRSFGNPTLWLLVLALGALLATGCASTRTMGERVDDATITSSIKGKLAADPQVNPFEIDVDVDRGVVRLTGTVDTEADRQEALQLARDTEGVRDVVNNIDVGEKTTGQSFDDAWITSKITTKFTADPQINPFNIDVDTDKGVVTLSGEVPSEKDRRAAVTLAADTKGVKRVRDRIKVVK